MIQKIHTSWQIHVNYAWYVNPAMDHYRYFKFWTPETQGYCIAQTTCFSQHTARYPSLTIMMQIALPHRIWGRPHKTRLPKILRSTLLHRTYGGALLNLQNFRDRNATKTHHHVLPCTPKEDFCTTPGGLPRVGQDHVPPLRVGATNAPTASNSPTAPANIWKTSLNHQQDTRLNTPIALIPEEVNTLTGATMSTTVPPTTAGILPRRSTGAQIPRGPIFISQAAVYHFLGSALEGITRLYTPAKLQKEQVYDGTDVLNLKHVCNSVVHPVTDETITKYKQLIKNPLTRVVWEHAMCYKLGRLSQGYLIKK